MAQKRGVRQGGPVLSLSVESALSGLIDRSVGRRRGAVAQIWTIFAGRSAEHRRTAGNSVSGTSAGWTRFYRSSGSLTRRRRRTFHVDVRSSIQQSCHSDFIAIHARQHQGREAAVVDGIYLRRGRKQGKSLRNEIGPSAGQHFERHVESQTSHVFGVVRASRTNCHVLESVEKIIRFISFPSLRRFLFFSAEKTSQ